MKIRSLETTPFDTLFEAFSQAFAGYELQLNKAQLGAIRNDPHPPVFPCAIRQNKNDTVKVINTAVDCRSVNGFLQAKNIPRTGKQFEMIKKI